MRPSVNRAKRFEATRMTVCLAALAAQSKAVVCVADRALTYGDRIQWDADIGKMYTTVSPSGVLLMMSDEGNGPRVLGKLFEGVAKMRSKSRTNIITACEEQYRAAVDDLVEARFLRPRLLNKAAYLAAITAPQVNDLLRSVADEIKLFDMACDLLVCSFDEDNLPLILDVQSPGIVNDMTLTVGFQAIGSGWEKASARLLFSEHKRTHSIERALYDCFDAKVFAEMTPGVGYEWDAMVIAGERCTSVPDRIKKIIEQAWTSSNQSPFERDVDEDDIPPRNWKKQLRQFAAECVMPSGSQMSAGQP